MESSFHYHLDPSINASFQQLIDTYNKGKSQTAKTENLEEIHKLVQKVLKEVPLHNH